MDVDKIVNLNMLTNPDIYGLIPVYVYDLKGYEDTEVIRKYYARVLAVGGKIYNPLINIVFQNFIDFFIHVKR